jgi:dTDP-4-dehydrorhamnose reductase
MKKNKILVTGSNGLLGQKLTDLLIQDSGIELIATGRGKNRHPMSDSDAGYTYIELDITDNQSVEILLRDVKPDIVIHTAAMTQVDDCEFEKELCVSLNIDCVEQLARLSQKLDYRLIHLSTDFIFDGTKPMYKEDDEPNPLSYYGWSKLEAEKKVLEFSKNYAILRTVLVYGKVADMSRSNIMLWSYNTLKDNKNAKVVDDQFRTPTLAEDLAVGCKLAALSNENGIFNIAGKDYVSIYELVEKIALMYGFEMTNIEMVSSDTLSQPAKRPPITGLDISKAREILNYEPHSLEDGIRICLGM